MAKTIKKIVCPQCGSNQVDETKKDHYICRSCNTQFFLDNDDITINHNYNTGKLNNEQGVQIAKKAIIGFSAVIFIYFAYQISRFIFADSTPAPVTTTEYNTTPPPKRDVRYVNASYSETALMIDPKGKNTIVFTGWFNDIFAEKGKENEVYTILLDATTGEEISRTLLEVDLSIKGAGTHSSKLDYYRGANDELFLIVNSYYLFLYNPSQKVFENVTESFFVKYPEFAGGVAAIESRTFDQCLTVTNNKGKQYALFADIGVVLPIDKISNIYDKKLTDPVKTTSYKFTRIGFDFPEEEIQLIQYEHWTQKGFPQYNVSFNWSKDYGRSGIFTEKSPYKKVLVMPYTKSRAKIVSIKDLTPNHTYVDGARVLVGDAESVIIAIKMSVLENETITLQKISGVDGSVLWTKKTDWKEIRSIDVEGDYILVRLDSTNIAIINKDGEIKMTSDFYELKTVGKEI
ncbi:hypothetical protein MODO_1836 [Myroides odoratimimus]|uniref:Uncharacterized protein n=2 Tax=Myroides odoratimimus TaxID=76832 RepID=A0A0S7EH53_9FLAO|nr:MULTISPECIES: TFIIB-type zinc finger domain-containing protein [Myroides]ALU24937.1 hypothetical protein AS202_01570 [Myroides odoratimimus]EHO05806.1 hypothetical protein HMPREF9712_03382 [Myroides odoratimimus CCUG 10230]MDM1085049.1 hypothetical protein [Myroides odoratimimus]MDM1457060.1 hypothetical protein [Myroides odoratimimus]MDX4974651.1 TFIIB-type zinc finger domain-containing protein [Myroides odoratimimus]